MQRNTLHISSGEIAATRTRFWRSAFAACLGFVLLLAACGESHTSVAPVKSTATATSVSHTPTAIPFTPFAAFSDWRLAYVDHDRYMHAVSLDGKTDVIGPNITNLTNNELNIYGSISPDGHTFINSATGLNIFDLVHGTTNRQYIRDAFYGDAWWHDGSKVIIDESGGNFWVVNIQSGDHTLIPGSPFSTLAGLYAWVDANHVVVGEYDANSLVTTPSGDKLTTAFYLDSLDVMTGAVRHIVHLTNLGISTIGATVSPDGSKAFFINGSNQDYPFTPLAYEIDLASGRLTPLPNIARKLGGQTGHLAWRPGTQQIAVSTGFLVNGDLHSWLIDLSQDSVTKLVDSQYVEQWTPDGRGLVLGTGQDVVIGVGPYDNSILTFQNNQPVVTLLTHTAYTFPFLGFVRTSP